MLGGMLPAGSIVTVTLQLAVNWSFFGGGGLRQYVLDQVEGALYGTGGFSQVSLTFEGSFTSNTVTVGVTVKTVYDHADVEDVGNWIQGAIQEYTDLNFKSRSAATSPNAVSNIPPQQQQNIPGSKCPLGYYDNGWFSVNCVPLPVNTPSNPSQCDWDRLSLADYAACQLGIKPTEAVIAGAVIALVGVIAISKLVK